MSSAGCPWTPRAPPVPATPHSDGPGASGPCPLDARQCATTRPTLTGPTATGSFFPAGTPRILLYSMLYLTGYDLTLHDLTQFRQLGSRTRATPSRTN